MAMSQNRQAGSNGSGTGFDMPTSMARSFALALSPFAQGLRFYADFQRSALNAFTRATGATGATVGPVTATASRPKPAAKPTPLKRATMTKPAAKAARSAPGGVNGRSASKKPAAAKAAPKRTLKSSAPGPKPAVAKKKVASKPTRPQSARANTAKKA
jgi:hypothetical protein